MWKILLLLRLKIWRSSKLFKILIFITYGSTGVSGSVSSTMQDLIMFSLSSLSAPSPFGRENLLLRENPVFPFPFCCFVLNMLSRLFMSVTLLRGRDWHWSSLLTFLSQSPITVLTLWSNLQNTPEYGIAVHESQENSLVKKRKIMWYNKSPEFLLNVLMAIISSHWPRNCTDNSNIIPDYTKQIIVERSLSFLFRL